MLDPPLQHALFHTNIDFRQRHYVQTWCGLLWETDDPPRLNEAARTDCLLCWHALALAEPDVAPRTVRGRLVEIYVDRRTP